MNLNTICYKFQQKDHNDILDGELHISMEILSEIIFLMATGWIKVKGILTRSLPKVYQLLDVFWQISNRMVLEPTAKRYLHIQDNPQNDNC